VDGTYTWYVRPWNAHGYGPWGDGMSFTVSGGGAGASAVPATPGMSGGGYRLYLPLIVKPAGVSEPPSGGPPTDDGDEGPPLEMRMREFGPPEVGEEIGPPLGGLGPGFGPPAGVDQASGPPR
jgi:hypothetical protein